MGISKITRNYQVTLPRDIREIKRFRVGEKVLFLVEGDKVELVKIDKNIVREAAGLWRGLKETGLEYKKRLRKGWSKRILL
ncbi:MAG: AbrB/MazE/SpoVT family DNA-binding domain-containing protein [Nanoarchaeota archaeon]